MRKIGLLSDTHGDLPQQVFDYFSEVDEIWHAGDIGDLKVTDALKKFKPLRAVFGNIDDQLARSEFNEHEIFSIENVNVVMTHIGGRPGNLSLPARGLIQQHQPKLFVCGHSHILLEKFDRPNNLLWLNPGACGNKGFHHMRTLLRFTIDNDKITNMEAIEIGKRSAAKQF
jgi:putative phosphoesterase